MLNDFISAERVYLAVGYTDLRKGIDGLAALVQQQFELDPFTNTLFLFCGRRKDRLKALYWEGDGFVLLYKRLESGSFQWPRDGGEVRALTWQQYRWPVEQVRLTKKKVYGASSEQTREELAGQLSFMFDEAEAWLSTRKDSPRKTEVAAHTRQKRSSRVEEILPENVPVEVVEHRQGNGDGDADFENAEAPAPDPRQLRLGGSGGLHNDPEICDVRPSLQAGAGMEPGRGNALPADDVQLDSACGGRLAAARL